MLAKVTDADEALALSREAALKLGADPSQLWIESQRLQTALRRPVPMKTPVGPPTSRAEDRALVRLLLHHPEARSELLPLLDETELGAEPLRAIVTALRQRPDAPGASLMTDLDEAARGLLAALLVEEEERPPGDPRASVADYRRRLDLGRRLRRLRQVSRAIAEMPAGPGETVAEQLRTLDREGRQVRASALGVAGVHHRDSQGSPRSAEA